MARRRKVGNLLALHILATLHQRPMHPYEIAAEMRGRGKEQDFKIQWGSLYTVVGNLEKHGFIRAAETTREGKRPERTVYSLTEAGRDECADWLRELVGAPEREYPRLRAALSVLGVLPPDEAAYLLHKRAEILAHQIAAEEAQLTATHGAVPRIFTIEAEFGLQLLRAEADYVRGLVAEIEDGTLSGVDMWRRLHEEGHD
ncbi:PadR family transcriptional regulator [Dactylosporangium vinaceum]|uniref:PadR family transcriptional regulator n=1 Tax=Dactylosporangium vinaceum TaxID=53362 RepID=A0ABV5M8J7_9ACTN|nr:PadR family transcriptional regulator [Dactylosporangium vinaceum]UAB94583.1 PadR family transcriptional regulator [Dactylosporangium vinaceum]